MKHVEVINEEIAISEENASHFLLAGGIYGGKIVLMTNEVIISAIFMTYDANKEEGMIITKEDIPDAFNIQTIYITHTTNKGSVRHIIEPVTDIAKKENNMIYYKGKLVL